MACGTSLKPETLASCQKQRPCTLNTNIIQGPKRLTSACASNWSGDVPFGLDNRRGIQFSRGRCAKSRSMCPGSKKGLATRTTPRLASRLASLVALACEPTSMQTVAAVRHPTEIGEPANTTVAREGRHSPSSPIPNDEEEMSQATSTSMPTIREATDALPYRLQLSSAEAPVPVISEFSVRFALPCVRSERSASAPPRLAAQVRGGALPRGYTLYARYDGHTPRSLMTGRSAPTEVPLSALSNEWADVEPGVHEVVVFAADAHGTVPRTSDGRWAVSGCRFRVTSNGQVEEVSQHGHPAYSFILTRGTLHGAKQTNAQVVTWGSERHGAHADRRARLPDAPVTVRVGRPDGGYEVHELLPGPFELAPLQPGDYTFTLHTSEPKTATIAEAPALGYEQRLIINPE